MYQCKPLQRTAKSMPLTQHFLLMCLWLCMAWSDPFDLIATMRLGCRHVGHCDSCKAICRGKAKSIECFQICIFCTQHSDIMPLYLECVYQTCAHSQSAEDQGSMLGMQAARKTPCPSQHVEPPLAAAVSYRLCLTFFSSFSGTHLVSPSSHPTASPPWTPVKHCHQPSWAFPLGSDPHRSPKGPPYEPQP